jgi:hypothetical protein
LRALGKVTKLSIAEARKRILEGVRARVKKYEADADAYTQADAPHLCKAYLHLIKYLEQDVPHLKVGEKATKKTHRSRQPWPRDRKNNISFTSPNNHSQHDLTIVAIEDTIGMVTLKNDNGVEFRTHKSQLIPLNKQGDDFGKEIRDELARTKKNFVFDSPISLKLHLSSF